MSFQQLREKKMMTTGMLTRHLTCAFHVIAIYS